MADNEADCLRMMEHLNLRLSILRSQDRGMEVFGAARQGSYGHEYKFNPVLSEEDIAQYEADNAVTLPEEYRAYIKYLGNGRAGPGYGIEPLEGKWAPVGLSSPFPYTQAISQADLRNPDAEHYPDDADTWNGCLSLCQWGCGWEDCLIVTGPCRGQIWCSRDLAFYPAYGSFVLWYHAWINESLVSLWSKRR